MNDIRRIVGKLSAGHTVALFASVFFGLPPTPTAYARQSTIVPTAPATKPIKETPMTQIESDTLFALGKSGAFHKRLQPMVGDWNVTQRIFGGGEPIVSVGVTAHKKWILDERQLQEEMSGSLARIEMHKLTFLGYNNINGRYEFTTFDNLDTQTMTYHGQPDTTGKVITMSASYTQAVYGAFVGGDGISKATGDKLNPKSIVGLSFVVRDVLTITDNDHHTLQMFFTPVGGKESLSVEYVLHAPQRKLPCKMKSTIRSPLSRHRHSAMPTVWQGQREIRARDTIQYALDPNTPETIQTMLDDIAPDFGKIIVEYVFNDIYARPGLDFKYRLLATFAAVTALDQEFAVEEYVRFCLNAGWTRTEIVEVIMQMSVYAGMGAAMTSLMAAKRAFATVDAAQSPDATK